MKKSLLMFLCAGAVAFSACNKTEKTESDTATVVETDNTSGAADTEAMYRDRAEKMTRRMATDLRFDNDTAIQSRVRQTYYTRATRLDEIRKRHASDTTGMYMELRNVDLETDKEFQSFLAPEQYTTFQTNRTTYYGGYDDSEMMDADSMADSASGTGGQATGTGSTSRTKTDRDGDTKTEIEGPNGQTKIKTEADGDVKVKTSPNK